MFCVPPPPTGVRSKHVDTEVSIMRKLVHHKNILQLLDWNTTEGERHIFNKNSYCCKDETGSHCLLGSKYL